MIERRKRNTCKLTLAPLKTAWFGTCLSPPSSANDPIMTSHEHFLDARGHQEGSFHGASRARFARLARSRNKGITLIASVGPMGLTPGLGSSVGTRVPLSGTALGANGIPIITMWKIRGRRAKIPVLKTWYYTTSLFRRRLRR